MCIHPSLQSTWVQNNGTILGLMTFYEFPTVHLLTYDFIEQFKLGKTSTETIQLLEDSQAKFQQQVLKKVSMLEIEFGTWERDFLSDNNLCSPT